MLAAIGQACSQTGLSKSAQALNEQTSLVVLAKDTQSFLELLAASHEHFVGGNKNILLLS